MDTVTDLDFKLGFNNGRPGDTAVKPRAKFYTYFMFDPDKSKEAMRPIFKSVVLLDVDTSDGVSKDIKTVTPNDMHKKTFAREWDVFSRFISPFVKTGMVDNYSWMELKKAFPKIYDDYISGLKAIGISGTLIEESGILPTTRAIELKYLGIFTVEQLARMAPNDHVKSVEIDAAKNYLDVRDNLQNVSELIKTCRKLTEKLNNLTDK